MNIARLFIVIVEKKFKKDTLDSSKINQEIKKKTDFKIKKTKIASFVIKMYKILIFINSFSLNEVTICS